MSEEIIGKALKKYDIPRHKIVILSKCYSAVAEDPEGRYVFQREQFHASKDYQNQFGLGRSAIFNQVEASLKRLDTPYLDLLQIHRFDNTIPVEETMKALHDLVQSGKVRYIGASSMWAYQFAQLQFCAEKNGWTKFISMQVSDYFSWSGSLTASYPSVTDLTCPRTTTTFCTERKSER